ncbi:MAG: S8 family peptidase [Proteobacteria bacterium]|nr:S8 family peptidase [Pseudomonadota bacterium]
MKTLDSGVYSPRNIPLKNTIIKSITIAVFLAVSQLSLAQLSNSNNTSPKPDDNIDQILVYNPATVIPNQYIVVLKDEVVEAQARTMTTARFSIADARARVGSDSGVDLATRAAGSLERTYSSALRGFVLKSLSKKAVERLNQDIRVAYIEADQTLSIDAVQNNATWGLDRIDQVDLPLNGTYIYDEDGTGVNVYVIDSGVRISHNLFGGRGQSGFTAINDGNGTNDCNGHGTHVAGTVGSSTYGVAKNATIFAVRVLDCNNSGSFSGVIAGVDWVAANHITPAVANMSLGGGVSNALDNAVNAVVVAGVTVVVSAGNDNANACNFSPARAANAITVGSTTSSDSRSSFSNHGACLDIFAPGSSITSTWYTSNSATNTISGTSMAAPHVAGVVALYLDANPNATPAQVQTAIENAASVNKVSNPRSGSPNLLLYNTFVTQPQPDQYDDVPAQRAYNDNQPGDAVAWLAESTVQNHNFHIAGDVDWTMAWVSQSMTLEFSTELIGANSDTKIEVFKYTDVELHPTDSGRFIVNAMVSVGSDSGVGNSSVTIPLEGGFLYGVKVESRTASFGPGTEYRVRIN